MRVSSQQRAMLVDLMLIGQVSPADVAAHLQISARAVRKWVDVDICAEARQARAGAIIAMALEDRIDPDKEQRAVSRIVSQINYKKREAIAKVRAGKMTIPKAARFAGVPISGMVGWLRIAGVRIPDEFNQPRRK